MRKIILNIFLHFLFITASTAQNTVNSSGNTLKGDEVTYAYSVGETVSFSLVPNCTYTQGVIQPSKFSFASGSSSFLNSYELVLYPNPSRNNIIIETDDPFLGNYQITTLDGRIVERAKFTYSPISIAKLQAGVYTLTLFSFDYKKRKTYKIIKL